MVETQKHLLGLMLEIQAACKEKDIPLSLCGRSAAMAVQSKKFVTQCYEMHMMVPAGALPDLAKKLLKNRKKAIRMTRTRKLDRGIESWAENPALPLNTVRYVDLNTTMIDRDDPVYYTKPGAAVTIHPLYTQLPDEETDRRERGWFYYYGGKPFNYGTMVPENKEVLDAFLAEEDALDMQKEAKKSFKLLKKQPPVGKAETVYLRKQDGLLLELPATVITELKQIPFEEETFSVPKDMNGYLLLQYGKKWKEKAFEPLKASPNVNLIIDGFTPFQSYLEYFKKYDLDLMELKKKMQKFIFWKCMEFKPIERKVNTEYLASKRSADRIDIYCRLKPLIPQMQELAKNKEIDRLGDMLSEYMEATERYYKKGLGFYINETLFDLADTVYKARKRKTYMEKVRALVPQIYLDEDVETFLRKRGYEVDEKTGEIRS